MTTMMRMEENEAAAVETDRGWDTRLEQRRRRLQRRFAAQAASRARRIQRDAAALARLDANIQLLNGGGGGLVGDDEEGHRATQFGWRSGDGGFLGIALYAAEVAAGAEALLLAAPHDD
jgi:hypothetical protein